MSIEILKKIYFNRQLTVEMTRREFSDRYAGQAFGLIWVIIHPTFLMALYVFIFAYVFKIRLPDNMIFESDYTTYILSGLVPWLSIQESIIKSCTAITSNSSLVKQVVFPIEILPIKGVFVSLLTQFISLIILFLYIVFANQVFHLSYFLLPIIIGLQLSLMTGISFFLSAIGVFFRDTKDVVQIITIVGIYLLPIFYIPEFLPSKLKFILYLNPFSHFIWCYQDILFFGTLKHPYSWFISLILSLLSFHFGYILFKNLKNQFGNIL